MIMKIERTMKLSAAALFEILERSIQTDIYTHTKQSLNTENFEGFEYIKYFANGDQALIRIDQYDPAQTYYYSTHTDKNRILVKYEIEPVDERSCVLHYTEEIDSHGFLQKINDTFVGYIWGYLKKKKFHEMLRQMENLSDQ